MTDVGWTLISTFGTAALLAQVIVELAEPRRSPTLEAVRNYSSFASFIGVILLLVGAVA